jgi:hypothetical protein
MQTIDSGVGVWPNDTSAQVGIVITNAREEGQSGPAVTDTVRV